MRRWLIALTILVLLGGLAIWSAVWFRELALPPIRVGILHSKSGPMEMQRKVDGRRGVTRNRGDQ